MGWSLPFFIVSLFQGLTSIHISNNHSKIPLRSITGFHISFALAALTAGSTFGFLLYCKYKHYFLIFQIIFNFF